MTVTNVDNICDMILNLFLQPDGRSKSASAPEIRLCPHSYFAEIESAQSKDAIRKIVSDHASEGHLEVDIKLLYQLIVAENKGKKGDCVSIISWVQAPYSSTYLYDGFKREQRDAPTRSEYFCQVVQKHEWNNFLSIFPKEKASENWVKALVLLKIALELKDQLGSKKCAHIPYFSSYPGKGSGISRMEASDIVVHIPESIYSYYITAQKDVKKAIEEIEQRITDRKTAVENIQRAKVVGPAKAKQTKKELLEKDAKSLQGSESFSGASTDFQTFDFDASRARFDHRQVMPLKPEKDIVLSEIQALEKLKRLLQDATCLLNSP